MRTALSCLVLLLLQVSSRGADSPIVGTWEMGTKATTAQSYVFGAEGKYTFRSGRAITTSGTYTFVDGKLTLVKLTRGRRTTTVYDATIDGDELLLKSVTLGEQRFKRTGAKPVDPPKPEEKPMPEEKPAPEEKPVLLPVKLEDEKKAIDAITKMAGSIWLEYKKAEEPVTIVSLTGEKVTDDVLKQLKAFINLRELRLTRAVVTNEGLNTLKDNKSLASVRINQCPKITGGALKSLGGVSGLREIWMEGSQVSTNELKAVAGLSNLRFLLILRAGITDEGLEVLSKLPRLESLFLEGNPLTNAGMKHVRKLTNLRELGVNASQVNDMGVKDIVALKKLEFLRLDDNMVTDACIPDLKTLPRLKTLFLHNTTGFSDKGLKEIAKIKTLRELTLFTSRIGKITDAGIRELKALPNLERLSLGFSQISGETIDELKKTHPKLEVTGRFND